MTELEQELQDLLGAEMDGAWVDFMDYVNTTLPFLFDAGRPSASQIKNSQIGSSGFTSWGDLIKSLGWNESSWRAWSRAYKIIVKFPYMRDLDLSASMINTSWNKLKPDFPSNIAEWELYRDKVVADQQEKQQNSLKEAQKQVKTARSEILSQRSTIDGFNGEKKALQAQIDALTFQVSKLTTDKATLLLEKEQVLKDGKAVASKLKVLKGKIQKHNDQSWFKRIPKI